MRITTTALVLVALGSACGDDSASGGSSSDTGSSSGTTGGGGGGLTASVGGGGADAGGAGGGVGGSGGAPTATCPTCADPTDLPGPANGAVIEASGLAASHEHANVFYVHNDSGDSARFFAVGADGSDQGTFNVRGANAVDWEDMARGPCGDGRSSCLYFGDIGDNPESRTSYAIYRVPEPLALGAGPHAAAAEAFVFQYPDGSHNAETLLVDAATGGVFIVTKSARNPRLYAFPLPLDRGKTATLTLLGDVNVPEMLALVTGGDIHPTGEGVLLRTYSSLWFYPTPAGTSIAEALAARPCSMPVSLERQGETAAWTADGNGYRTLSEGRGQSIHAVACR